MHRFRELSLRTQLLLLAILLTIPSLGIIIFNGYKQRNEDLRQAAVETQKLADNIAAEQEHLTHEAEQLGKLIAQLPEVKQRDPDKVRSILATILNDNSQYLDILIADSSGSVWSSGKRLKHPVSVADRSYFKNALASKRFSSGEYVIGKISGNPTLAMGYPLLDRRGEVEGVVALSFNLDRLKPLLERSQLPHDTNYVIVDHKGIIISRGHDAAGLVGTSIKPDAFKSMEVNPDKATYEIVRRDGDRRILTHRKLWLSGEQRPYLYVLAGISYKTAVAKAYREIVYNSALLVPFVIIAFALVFYIGKRSISDRVTVLDNAARQLAFGSLPGKIADLVKGGELGHLGETFDDMARQLKIREQALQDSHTLLQQTFASLNEAVFIVQTGTRMIQDVNITVERMFGYTRDELIGSTTSCLHVNEEMSQQFGSAMLKAYAEKGLFETTFKMRRKDGTVFDSEHCVTPIRDENGAIVRHVCVVRDISERKRSEQVLVEKTQMLADINDNLELMVNKTVSELRQKDQMLIQQSRLAAMGEMINNIAHQWRQPLNNIGLIVQNLKYDFEAGQLTQEGMAADMELTMDTIRYMSRTIDDFRNFFRQDKEQREFKVAQALSTIMGILDASLKKNGVKTEISADDNVSCSGYLNEYGQALLNIIINAKDVLVERHVAGPVIRIRVFSEHGKSVVTIRDNGGGIGDDVLPRIFDPYFSTKEPGKGTGIGLYMSKAIIEKNMNGRLIAENVDGGAEFRIEV
jgi:PAS domain S-box-containing protein